MLLPLLTGQPLPPEKLQFATEELNVALKQFEEKFLQDKPFIAGSEISLADLVALVELMQVSIKASTAGYVSRAVGRPGQARGWLLHPHLCNGTSSLGLSLVPF